MRWAARTAACAGAFALVAAVGTPAHAVTWSPSKSSQPSFIDALSAIPEASQALATAKAGMEPVRARFRSALMLASAARARVIAANQRVREIGVARAHADLAVQRAQATIDEAARLMYTSGGTVPSVAEVLLTADSESGFVRSMLTREYLANAAGSVVGARNAATLAVAASGAAVKEATAQRDEALAALGTADADAASAQADVVAAHAVVKEARRSYKTLMRITSTDRSAEYGSIKKCGDWLTKLLSRAGFAGEDLREAWAIVMRESGGREDAVSVTNDLGLFQINTATWRGQPWFDRKELLTRGYNARVGFLLSQGGKSWYSWGLDGHGRPDAGAYLKAGWTPEHIYRSIVEKYIAWYQAYPCRPSYEKGYPYTLPTPNSDEEPGAQDQFAGGGFVPDAPGGPSGPSRPDLPTALVVPPKEALAGSQASQ